MEKRYEVFISSTFRDLFEERQIIKNIIIQQDNFPTGMEWFVGGRPPWHHIEKAIKSCDYYVLIVGGRYGAINPKSDPPGLSFTECEYHLASKLGKEILPVVLSEEALRQLPTEKREAVKDKKDKLKDFREHLMNEHTVIKWNNLEELRIQMPEKIAEWLKENEVVNGGWVKAKQLRKVTSQGQIFNYLFNRLNPHDNVSLTLQLISQLDEKLDSIADVINVLEWLIKTYVEELIDAPIRVYFAFSLNPEHLAEDWWRNEEKSIESPQYRLGISNSKDGSWRQGGILKGRSNIHHVYKTCHILPIEDSTRRVGQDNVPVTDEGSVIAAPVYAISPKIPVGVVGINSSIIGEAPKHRGLVKELSALFSSLFYAYCNQLDQEIDWKDLAKKTSPKKSKFFPSFRDMFDTKTPQPVKRNFKHDFLTYRIRNEIVKYFKRVLEDTDLIK